MLKTISIHMVEKVFGFLASVPLECPFTVLDEYNNFYKEFDSPEAVF